MPQSEPYRREARSGPGVVCLHSNASSSSQWRRLIDLLSTDHHVLAPDLYGAGESVDWHSDRQIALRDEVEFIEPVLAKAGEPFSLIGHSYGGAVALMAALANPKHIRSLVLYEPTLFCLVKSQSPPAGSVDGIQEAVRLASAALDVGDREGAAEHFIDFWMGEGSWKATPVARGGPIAESVVNVRLGTCTLHGANAVECFCGARDANAVHGGREVSRVGTSSRASPSPVLPNVTVIEIEGWGHMAPITHAESVNAKIAAFVREA